jgi:hypothetical protein
MFVVWCADNLSGDATIGASQDADDTVLGTRFACGELETMALGRGRARGWSCPHCAVENVCLARDDADVVECDYCGLAFAPA